MFTTLKIFGEYLQICMSDEKEELKALVSLLGTFKFDVKPPGRLYATSIFTHSVD